MAEEELLLVINNTFALRFLQATCSENSVWKAWAMQPGSAESKGFVCSSRTYRIGRKIFAKDVGDACFFSNQEGLCE